MGWTRVVAHAQYTHAGTTPRVRHEPSGRVRPDEAPTPPEGELFDLEADPREMRNVYADPACADVVAALKAELARLKEPYGDPDDVDLAFVEVNRRAWE